ncbi:hypothetical protein, partial [Nocardia cyriacigeorgica]|uniref:hypothetical protein n=1 Tax=Nocardia cyriacigeorgica TaxID=135487 RepID=UPI002453B3AB
RPPPRRRRRALPPPPPARPPPPPPPGLVSGHVRPPRGNECAYGSPPQLWDGSPSSNMEAFIVD